jgi:glycosyltransferase 2 family protein
MNSRTSSILRAIVSVSILAFILSRVSLRTLVGRAGEGTPAPLVGALLLVLLMAILVSLRWRLLAQSMSLRMPVTLAMRSVFLGLFAGQLLPSALGSDLFRGWAVARRTGRIQRVAATVIADRLVALFAACGLLMLSYGLPGVSHPGIHSGIALVALIASGVLLLVFLLVCSGTLKRRFGVRLPFFRAGEALEGMTLEPKRIGAALGIALGIHAIATVVAALSAAAYGIDASLATWFAVIPMSVIASALPISINGWGVRESVIVALAHQHGVPQVDALLLSLTLGALNVLASLPGGYLLFLEHRT